MLEKAIWYSVFVPFVYGTNFASVLDRLDTPGNYSAAISNQVTPLDHNEQ